MTLSAASALGRSAALRAAALPVAPSTNVPLNALTTMKHTASLLALVATLALATGCVGVSYQRQSFAPDGKPQEVVKARATSLFTTKAFDTLKAASASPGESRTFSVSRYTSDPDAEAIKETGAAAGNAVGSALDALKK